VTRDLAIAGIAALALHSLILSFPLAGRSTPAQLFTHKPMVLSIVHPRAPVAPAPPALSSLVPPAPPTHEISSVTRKQKFHETTVVSGKAWTSEKSFTKIDTSETKKISKEIVNPEALRPLSRVPEPAEKEISVQAGEEETETARAVAPVEAVPTDEHIPVGRAEISALPETQAGGQEVVVSARPRYAENPPPPYPRAARQRGYEGRTVLRVEVLETGKVGGIEVANSSGFDLLDEASVRAVKDWHFVPGTKNGKRIGQWVVVPIRFSLK
jgi:protein TonB